MNIDKEKLLKAVEESKANPKTLADWILDIKIAKEDKNEFMHLVDALIETYEIVIKDNHLYLGAWDNFYHGHIRINRRGFGFIDFEDRASIYVSKENLDDVYDQDLIIVKVINDKDEGHVEKVLKRHLKRVVGTVYSKRLPAKFIADNLMYENKIEILNLDEFEDLNRYKVLLEVVSFKNNKIQAKVMNVLGYMDDPGVDILAVLLENNLRVEWPKDVMQEVKNVSQQVNESELKGRRDLRDELIFTIDGDSAKDLDDAVSIKRKGDNYVLSVHIMDVDHYVKAESAIDKEAYLRGTSVYVVDRVVSMLPPQLSNGICSLNPNEDRLAMSVEMEINHNGNVVNYDIFESVIESKMRLTYQKVNEIFANKSAHKSYNMVKDSLYMMRDLAEILQKKRVKLGALDFEKDELDLEVNKKGLIERLSIRERGEAERLIESFMVLTNETVARMMDYSNWPSIYRIHAKPELTKIRDFANLAQIMGFPLKGSLDNIHPDQLRNVLIESHDSDAHFVLSNQLLRSMQKAQYSLNNIGHFGLGSKEYGHFTSPIRRYPDLILHRLVKRYLFENKFNDFDRDEEYIEEASNHLSKMERAAISAERSVNDMKIAEYMEQHVGEIYSGIISSVHNFGMFVQLDNLVEGLIKVDTLRGYYNVSPDGFSLMSENNPTYKIGQRIKIRVTGANKALRNVDFEIYQKPSTRPMKRKPKAKIMDKVDRKGRVKKRK